jgi:hypothetical protein
MMPNMALLFRLASFHRSGTVQLQRTSMYNGCCANRRVRSHLGNPAMANDLVSCSMKVQRRHQCSCGIRHGTGYRVFPNASAGLEAQVSVHRKNVVVEIPQADMMGGVPADVLSAVLAWWGRPYRKPRRKNFRQEQLLCWLLAEIRVRNEEMYARSSCVAIKLKRGGVT